MPKSKFTKKDKERVYEVAINLLRNKHHKEYVALRSKFTQEERNLVGEIMNGPVSKFHSEEATEAYRRVVLTEHKIFGVKEVVVQDRPKIPKKSIFDHSKIIHRNTGKTKITVNLNALYGQSILENPVVKKALDTENKMLQGSAMKNGFIGKIDEIVDWPGNTTNIVNPVTITTKDIQKAINKIRKSNTYNKILENVAFIAKSREFWLSDQFFKFTREEIDNADQSGYIGTKAGIRCYIKK